MHESIYCVRSSIPPLNWVSYIEVRDGINESSTMIGTRLCGEYPPSIPIQASGSELHLKLYSHTLDLDKRRDEVQFLYKKIGGFRGFKIKIDAETGNDIL